MTVSQWNPKPHFRELSRWHDPQGGMSPAEAVAWTFNIPILSSEQLPGGDARLVLRAL